MSASDGKRTKAKLKAQTKDIKFRHLTDEDKHLGGALFITLYSVDDRVNLTDVWPNYQFLIEVYKRHKGISSARVKVEGNMDPRETKDAIIEMLEFYEASGYDKKKIREARKQYDSIMTNQLSSFALELQTLQEKHKKTIIEPQHVPAQHRRRAPELHEIVAEAWGNRFTRAEEAVKNLYLIMEAYSRVKEKTLSTPTYDDAKSTRTSTASSSVSSTTRLSTTSIESVLKRCTAKYNRDFLKKAENELKQLKKLDRDLKHRSDLEKRKYLWHMKGSEGPTELLKSISKPERPLHVVLQWAKEDRIEGSEYALLEYGSLLHSEKLFSETENPTGLSDHAVGTSASVYEPTERNSVEEILHSMRKVVNKKVYAQAKEEYKKLQEIEKMLARDDVLRARKDNWKIYVRDGPQRYIDVEIPNRPLHIVLNRAHNEHVKGSEFALLDYGSMLHSEVLYESKDNMPQKTLSTPTYDDAKSTRTSTASSSVSSTTRLSTTSIESVLKRCTAKYNRDFLKKAENELKQLKKLDRDLKHRSDLEKRKYLWHMKGSEGPTELLKSISKPERPLHVILQLAKEDRIEGSEYALLEYGSLLHSEKLFSETENPTGLSEHAVGTSASVYEPTERNSVEEILHSMRKVVNKEVYAQAKEEYKKLQEIEKMLARDDVLRARKDNWKIYVRDGPQRYIDVEIPNRPLHIVLNRAHNEHVKGSEFALLDYGSMLHSEVLYESKDNMPQKTLSTPTYDDAKSTRTSTASSSVSSTTRLSTTSIESVLKRCTAKYNRDFLKKAENELKQLKKLDRDLKYRSDLEERKYLWHMKGSEGPTELLKSISKPERPLHVVLQWAKDDRIEGSEYALLEYGSLLHSEKLFSETENPTGLSEHAVGTSASVYEPTERNSVEEILHSMRKVVNKEVYAQAKEEYKKLQEIEKMLARDDVLRARKDNWKIYVRDGPQRYIDVEIPNRPLHIVLNRAHNEHVKGSEFALMDYGSMLHSEVLYESKDIMPQIVPMPQKLKKTEDNQARHRTIVHVDKEPDSFPIGQDREPKRKERERVRYVEEQLFKLQTEIDKLKEQLNIKNSEVEDSTSRLSQAASNSLMHNNPSIADLSDKNRPIKLGERFGQLYDSEWSDAHETLKLTISSENEIFLILADVVKDIFRYCEEALRQQITDIKHDLENRTREPNFYYNTKKFHAIGKTDEMLSWTCEKYATEFQKGNAMYSVQGLTKIYKDYCKHRRFLDKHPRVIEKIDPYIDVTVEICWLMCAQTPPMQLVFAERNSKVDKSYFRCMGHSGNTVDICIWPAVLLHDGGPVVMKGQVLPL